MKIIFVGGKYSGNNAWEIEQNVRKCEEFALEIAKLGATPISINVLGRFYNDVLPYEFWIEGAKSVIDVSHAMFLVPGWEQSSGTNRENLYGLSIGKPIFTDMEDLTEWLNEVSPIINLKTPLS